MFKTIIAYKKLINSQFYFYCVFLPIFIGVVVSTSFFVFNIKGDLQDVLLSILSILFPLIAGFLTFGRDTLKSIRESIEKIKNQDQQDVGPPTTDIDKQRIKRMDDLAIGFVNVVINTFFISFALIIFLLIAKFNDFEFLSSNKFVSIKLFLFENVFVVLIKLAFFFLSYMMLLNTLYLTIFIVRITRSENKLIGE